MSVIPFGEWLPDQARMGSDLHEIENVKPLGGSYLPLRSLEPITNPVPGPVRGSFTGRDREGVPFCIVGTGSGLYRNSGMSWIDHTRSNGAYTSSVGSSWQFAQYGTLILCTNGQDPLQSLNFGSGESSFSDLLEAPRPQVLGVVRDYLVGGDVDAKSNRVRWSAFNDPLTWTLGEGGADFQDLPEGGRIEGIAGGETGYIFCENAIYSMVATGDSFVFQFDRLTNDRGLFARNAWKQVGEIIYLLSNDGFYAFSGGTLRGIGAGKVDRFFFEDLLLSRKDLISCAYDPHDDLVYWAYPSRSNVHEGCDRLIIFSPTTGQWTRAEIETAGLQSYASGALTLEDLDGVSASLDALPVSLDSHRWMGERRELTAFDSENRLCQFSGPALSASLETNEFHPNPAGRAFLYSVQPLVEQGQGTIEVKVRDRLDQVPSGRSYAIAGNGGFVGCEVSGRFFRLKLHLNSAIDWQNALGVRINFIEDGVY